MGVYNKVKVMIYNRATVGQKEKCKLSQSANNLNSPLGLYLKDLIVLWMRWMQAMKVLVTVDVLHLFIDRLLTTLH